MNNNKIKKFFFWISTLLFPLAALLILEVILRAVNYGNNLSLTATQEINGKKYYTLNSGLAKRYFPTLSIPAPRVYDDCFEATKSQNTYRIFCLGESSMQGFPYEYNASLPRLIKDRLVKQFPDLNFEVINLGITAVNSYAVLDLVKEIIEYKPDLLILYLGHNEFYGSFGVGSSEYLGKNRTLIHIYLILNRFKTFRLIRDVIYYFRSFWKNSDYNNNDVTLMETMANEKKIPYRSQLYEIAKNNFKKNLSDIAETANSNKIPVILSTLISNLRNQPPFISDFQPSITPEQKEKWTALFEEGKKNLKENNPEEALRKFKDAQGIDNSRGDLSYQIAKCFDMLKNFKEARGNYETARDLDMLRFRATGEFNEIIRSVTSERKCLLADLEKTFENISADSIIGGQLMLEHVHPNMDGYFCIAKEYVQVMQQNDKIRLKDKWPTPPSDEQMRTASMVTPLDIEVAMLRMDNLRHHWPFSEPDSTRYRPKQYEGTVAISYLNKKITWDQAHYRLADYYKRQQKFKEAEREYNAVAKVLWSDYNPLIFAGDMQMSLENYRAAEEYYKAARERADNQFTQVRLGAVYLEIQKPDSAIYYLRNSLDIDSRADSKFKKEWKLQVLSHLSKAYALAGDTTEACRELNELLSIDPLNNQAREYLKKLNNHGL